MAELMSRSRAVMVEQDRNGPTPEEVREQLRRILESRAFQASKRCRQFLEYVCGKLLAGEGATLKERTIATEVFGRRPQSDLGEDTVVRVGAREVRRRLAQYYMSADGAAARIRIALPTGTYVPEIRWAEAKPESGDTVPASAVARRVRRRSQWLLGAAAAVALALAAVGWAAWRSADPAARAFESFWGPVIDSRQPLLVAVGHPLVYHPSLRALKLNEERLPPLAFPAQRPLRLRPEELDGSDIIPVANQYVGFGNMVAATEVAGMLGRWGASFRVRLAANVEFADLRQSPVLLIGAITNRWTMELGQGWRFQFDRTPGHSNVIVDTRDPSRRWQVAAREDGLTPSDYILISRIANSPTGGLLLVAAGVKQFGTEAAGRLLTDPGRLGAILSRLPEGWERKDVQVVLEVKVIGNTPAQPELVAWHVG